MTIIVVYSQQNSITMNPKEYKDVVYKIIGSALKVHDELTREQRHRCMALILNRRQTECKQVYLELPRCEPTNEARVETKFTLIFH